MGMVVWRLGVVLAFLPCTWVAVEESRSEPVTAPPNGVLWPATLSAGLLAAGKALTPAPAPALALALDTRLRATTELGPLPDVAILESEWLGQDWLRLDAKTGAESPWFMIEPEGLQVVLDPVSHGLLLGWQFAF